MVHPTTVINLKKYLSAVMTNTLDALAQLTTAIIKVSPDLTVKSLLTAYIAERETKQQFADINRSSLALLYSDRRRKTQQYCTLFIRSLITM